MFISAEIELPGSHPLLLFWELRIVEAAAVRIERFVYP